MKRKYTKRSEGWKEKGPVAEVIVADVDAEGKVEGKAIEMEGTVPVDAGCKHEECSMVMVSREGGPGKIMKRCRRCGEGVK